MNILGLRKKSRSLESAMTLILCSTFLSIIGWGSVSAEEFSEKARDLLQKAEQGNAVAQVQLGMLYETGDGVRQDYKEAAKWYGAAANQGNPYGLNNMATMYRRGWGVKQDFDKAIKWYKQAASQGDAQAKETLKLLE